VIAALIFVISLAAFGQFGFFYLRAVLISVASQELSTQVQETAGFSGRALQAEDFGHLLNLNSICPKYEAETGGLKTLRAYFSAVDALSRLVGKHMPAYSEWAQKELVTCARYAAVILDQRVALNQAAAAELRSY
jgi:hypothetical protein